MKYVALISIGLSVILLFVRTLTLEGRLAEARQQTFELNAKCEENYQTIQDNYRVQMEVSRDICQTLVDQIKEKYEKVIREGTKQ